MKLLLVVTRYPWPPRRGDQLRAVQLIELLGDRHELTLLAPMPRRDLLPPPPGNFQVEVFDRRWLPIGPQGLLRVLRRGLALQCGLFFEPDLGWRIRRLVKSVDLAILQLVRPAAHLADFRDVPLVVDLIDSLSLNFERRAALESPWRRPLFALEAKRLAATEAQLLARAKVGWVVCERDRAALAEHLPPALAKRLDVVPLAFPSDDEGDPSRRGAPPWPPWAGEAPAGPYLALTGNLGYFPTVDGFCWWLAEVWPHLAATRADLEVVVAGARPARRLRRAIARAGARVRLIASPPDLQVLLAGASLALAPLRSGSGQPLKILEAFQLGVPVVASPWAAAGLEADPGIELLIASSAGEWTRQILTLLDDPAARDRLRAAASTRLRAEYGREVVRQRLLTSLWKAIDTA